MGENYASREQLKLVGTSCHDYDPRESLTSGAMVNLGRSCETCNHWTGARCDIDVFDKVLMGLDQE
ncbi:hypothetical protein [Fonticella tunisiensis]|uniref:Uncharacterized protein n=1 Tax=Fonticella tunisiensis TaxID=1096341 RepID=A0A4R7KQJ0_9CLOT|nr:hypothetical protein [Fonticella tunisiensis]TDT60954.1 hypothetical protein EDD71_11072 [Fonticella tunisiensis]